MAYKRKTEDEWQLWVDYGCGDGFEHELSAKTNKELLGYVRTYREEVPQFPLKTKLARVRINAD